MHQDASLQISVASRFASHVPGQASPGLQKLSPHHISLIVHSSPIIFVPTKPFMHTSVNCSTSGEQARVDSASRHRVVLFGA